MKFNKASASQIKAARRFSESDQGSETMSLSQAVKYLDECFELARGEITQEEFEMKTGHKPHKIRY
jgi:hypothetical protein